jgi:hypothetical protein
MGIATALCLPMNAQSDDDAMNAQLQSMKLMKQHSQRDARPTDIFCEQGACATPMDIGSPWPLRPRSPRRTSGVAIPASWPIVATTTIQTARSSIRPPSSKLS